jgi:DNA-binding transcriptional MerR regulator
MAELLKISQLAERAGVQKATVAYYVKEGLLPRPARKPHRNMAYYSAESVERIRLIKDLQAKRFLPLSVIKKIFADKKGIEEIRAFVESGAMEPTASLPGSIERARLLAETGLGREDLETLTRLGYVRGLKSGGKLIYHSAEAAIVRAVGRLRQAGLGAAGGFRTEELAMYKEAMEELVRQEVSLFSQRVVGRAPRKDVLRMARAGLEGTTDLLIALRRKIIMDFLGDGAQPRRRRGAR